MAGVFIHSDLLTKTINILVARDLKLHFIHDFLGSFCYTLSQLFVRHVLLRSVRSHVLINSVAILFLTITNNVYNWIYTLHNQGFIRFCANFIGYRKLLFFFLR